MSSSVIAGFATDKSTPGTAPVSAETTMRYSIWQRFRARKTLRHAIEFLSREFVDQSTLSTGDLEAISLLMGAHRDVYQTLPKALSFLS